MSEPNKVDGKNLPSSNFSSLPSRGVQNINYEHIKKAPAHSEIGGD